MASTSYPYALPFDDSRASDCSDNKLANPGWDKSDDWKIKRKSRVRMANPAAKLANKPAGFTFVLCKKTNTVSVYLGKRLIRKMTIEQAQNMANGK